MVDVLIFRKEWYFAIIVGLRIVAVLHVNRHILVQRQHTGERACISHIIVVDPVQLTEHGAFKTFNKFEMLIFVDGIAPFNGRTVDFQRIVSHIGIEHRETQLKQFGQVSYFAFGGNGDTGFISCECVHNGIVSFKIRFRKLRLDGVGNDAVIDTVAVCEFGCRLLGGQGAFSRRRRHGRGDHSVGIG